MQGGIAHRKMDSDWEGTVTTDGGAPKVLPCSHGHIRQTQGAPGGRWTSRLRGGVSVSGSLGGQSS